MPTLYGRNYQLQELQSLWGAAYEDVLGLLGTTAIILPFGDPHHGQPDAATFTTIGEEQVTFTWSEPPASFDTPLDLTSSSSYQGLCPKLTLNGTDEEADSPDAAFWTRALGAVSIAVWINISTAETGDILSKLATNEFEWAVRVASGAPTLALYDASAGNQQISTLADAALAVDSWHHMVCTYDGSADGTGINTYVDGSLVASSDIDDAGFISSEDKDSTVTFGFRAGGAQYLAAQVAGGPAGPSFTLAELTADQILRYYQVTRRLLGV